MTTWLAKGESSSPSVWGNEPSPKESVGHKRAGSGSSSGPLASPRPGSADSKLDLAPAHHRAWNSHRERSSQTKLPGIRSILNEPQETDKEPVPWKSQSQYHGGQSAQYNSFMESHGPPKTASEVQGVYPSSGTRQDGPMQGKYNRQPDHHRSYAAIAGEDTRPTFANPKQQGFDGSPDASSPKSATFQPDHSPRTPGGSSSAAYFVRTQNIPGQGQSHVYSDGSTCKAVVNGKPVRADWGVTKLGAPRKRQAEACIACRSKKIKCERVAPSRICAHCIKQRVECRWAPRSSTTSSEPDDEWQHAAEYLEGGISHSTYISRVSQSPKRSPTPRTAKSSNDTVGTPVKNYDECRLNKRPRLASRGSGPPSFWGPSGLIVPCDRQEIFNAGSDPFEENPDIAKVLLDKYFDYRECHLAIMFPRRSFTRWCFECKDKTRADRMILYAILALGSTFSTSIELKTMSQHLADLAQQLEKRETGEFSVQLAQARIHLSFYYWAKGNANYAFEYTASACRILSALRYNTEEGCCSGVSYVNAENDFEFSTTELIECRRRTFWCGYITDRFNGYCSGHIGLLSNQDVWVALPNNEIDFQSGINAMGPLFNNGACNLTGSSNLALLVGIISIWGDVTADAYRSIHLPQAGYVEHHTSFYAEINKRFTAWEAELPANFKLCTENTLQSIAHGRFVPYYLTHTLYLITAMKINRYGRSELLPADLIRRKIRLARHYAHVLLDLASTVARSDVFLLQNRTIDLENAVSQPFPCYAILGACDILSCRGIVRGLSGAQNQLGHAKTIVSESARFFHSAKNQKKWIESRLSELGAHVAMKAVSNRPTWRFTEPMEKTFIPKETDLIYSVDNEVYYGALDEETPLRESLPPTDTFSKASPLPELSPG